MPRDMTGTGRYPPQPLNKPIAFYSAVRLGEPEKLAEIMEADPYFVTQDNGAGAPLHFATTYKQLDMVHHLLNVGAEINQRDDKGFTALHRAAYLAHHDGYLEIYEYLLSRGADPSIKTEDYDPYLDPGKKIPKEVAVDDEEIQDALEALELQYKSTNKVREPHPDIGCWWTLYDYGLEAVSKWPKDYNHVYPEVLKNKRDKDERQRLKAARRKKQNVTVHVDTIPSVVPTPATAVAPDTPIAFLFPGQGSQAVGMLKECQDLPAVRRMLASARGVLGYDLLALCLEGPRERLDDTAHAQPALFLAGLAAVEVLRARDSAAVEGCSVAAGLSLGEYCALVFAGALSFEDGLQVVKVRGEAMAAAARQGRPHGMLSIIGLNDDKLEPICAQARASVGGGCECRLANFLFPSGRVVSGHKDALAEVQKLATAAGAMKCTMLAVSGAFHTPLMQPAREALVQVLGTVQFRAPRIPVVSNVTGAPFGAAGGIPALLARQLVEPVQWERTLAGLVAQGKDRLFELGPGAQIRAMLKRISLDAWKACQCVSV